MINKDITQHTTVDWIEQEMLKGNLSMKEILEQAKEMEEGAIIVSWHKGYDNQSPMIDENNCGQQYYNETYGGNK
jgi:hypothetical protein